MNEELSHRQELFFQYFLDRESDTFSNAYQSAMKAGYDCCEAPKEVSRADEGTACYVCAKCKQEFLTPEDFDQALPDLHIAGQISALEWLLMNASCGGDWRRLCEQKISQLKGE